MIGVWKKLDGPGRALLVFVTALTALLPTQSAPWSYITAFFVVVSWWNLVSIGFSLGSLSVYKKLKETRRNP